MELAEQYGLDRIALSVYLGVRLVQAAGEIRSASATELFERFVAWTR